MESQDERCSPEPLQDEDAFPRSPVWSDEWWHRRYGLQDSDRPHHCDFDSPGYQITHQFKAELLELAAEMQKLAEKASRAVRAFGCLPPMENGPGPLERQLLFLVSAMDDTVRLYLNRGSDYLSRAVGAPETLFEAPEEIAER